MQPKRPDGARTSNGAVSQAAADVPDADWSLWDEAEAERGQKTALADDGASAPHDLADEEELNIAQYRKSMRQDLPLFAKLAGECCSWWTPASSKFLAADFDDDADGKGVVGHSRNWVWQDLFSSTSLRLCSLDQGWSALDWLTGEWATEWATRGQQGNGWPFN